jgi:type II secretory pathway pseudopilin PulG
MRGDEDGFTLIEALVALALGVSVVAVVLSTLHVASNGATKAVSVAAEAEGFARAGSVLAGDARHGLLLRDGRGDVVFHGKPQKATFPAVSRSGLAPVVLEFDLRPAVDGTDLTRSEAVWLTEGPGPVGLGQAIWRGPGAWEFRYLDDKGAWLREWTAQGLPRAFGLVALTAPQTVELVAAFPDLMEPDCALGPGPKCSLASGVFP